jgi:hypothetical protein|tara:strand:+ start:314 stop:475 length:162 start_codon:yes stop_codon:yes gene_type:complete
MYYEKIVPHIGHKIEVATYGDPIVNVSVECVDCYEVIVDGDKSELEYVSRMGG